jgi:hypothetical protein
MKHTPGPWIVDYDGTIGHIKAVNVPWDGKGYKPTPTIARYDSFSRFGFADSSITPEQEKANARLIASAPELLEAAILARSLCRDMAVKTKDSHYHDMADYFDKAIAKAEGRE